MDKIKYYFGLIKPFFIISVSKKYLFAVFILILPFCTFAQHNNLTDSLKKDTTLRTGLIGTNASVNTNNSQIIDTSQLNEVNKKSIKRATIYSAILPGMGQAYNERYWKIPIIYAGFAGIYFLAEENNYKYHEFKKAYNNALLEIPNDPKFENYSKSQLESKKDYYKRNRDLNYIMAGLLYLLNILDANVDANLMDYDINEDLSLRIKPEINNVFDYRKFENRVNYGLKFVLSMH